MNKTLPFTCSEVSEWTKTIPTPFYVYDEAGIRKTVEAVNEAFSWNEGFCEHFAVKACPTPGILRLLRSLGCGTDCASPAEVALSLKCNFSGADLIYTANEVLPEEYRYAEKAGAILNLDDLYQVKVLTEAAGIIPDTVFMRYNPGSFEGTSAIMGNLYDSKFGMPKDQLFTALQKMQELGTQHFGIHAMLASCCLREDYYRDLAALLFELLLEIREKLGITIEYLDLAGGIGIPYRPEEEPVDIRRVGELVHDVYDRMLTPKGLHPVLYTEMGRFITGPHGYLLTKVVGEKHIYKDYIGVDATAACLMRPAIYGSYHHITVLGKETEPAVTTVDVVGSLCENNDKFAVDRCLPHVEAGDILAIHDAGAHGHSMGYQYNGKLRPAEYLLREDGSLLLIRRKEELSDYFRTTEGL